MERIIDKQLLNFARSLNGEATYIIKDVSNNKVSIYIETKSQYIAEQIKNSFDFQSFSMIKNKNQYKIQLKMKFDKYYENNFLKSLDQKFRNLNVIKKTEV